MNFKSMQVVEWSASGKCFHVETVEEMLRDNVGVLKGQCMTDYLPVGFFYDDAEMERFLNKAYEVVLQRFGGLP